jgi:hypothetical protein
MLISMLTTRTTSQRARTRVGYWTPSGGSEELVVVDWDPLGPLSARQAAIAAMYEAIRALERMDVGEASHPLEGAPDPARFQADGAGGQTAAE